MGGIAMAVALTVVYMIGWFTVFGTMLGLDLTLGNERLSLWKVLLAATFWPVVVAAMVVCGVVFWFRSMW